MPDIQASKNNLLTLLPLFMVILIDVAGMILVLPVLTPLILEPNSGLIPGNISGIARDFLYGFTLALFPFFMFLSTPVLGDLSDKFGRKKILLLCLLGSALSYVISAVGIIYQSFSIVIFSRAIAGLAAGTQPIATAAIIDASSSQYKSGNLSWVVFASSVGLILGPVIGGLTAEKNIVSWFDYQTPFFLAAGVSVLNAIFLIYSYTEIQPMRKDYSIKWLKGFTLFLGAFREKNFCILSLLYFCFTLSWSLYYQTINWLFMARFHYGTGQLGLFVAYIGIIFAISTSIVARLVLNFFSRETTTFAVFVLIMGIANLGAASVQSELAQWLWVIFNACGDVICYTVALTIFSNMAGKDAQGWSMGVAGSLGALTWTVGGLIAGPLGYISITLPLWVAGGLCFASFALTCFYQTVQQLNYSQNSTKCHQPNNI